MLRVLICLQHEEMQVIIALCNLLESKEQFCNSDFMRVFYDPAEL
jgi:hypothetical protein